MRFILPTLIATMILSLGCDNGLKNATPHRATPADPVAKLQPAAQHAAESEVAAVPADGDTASEFVLSDLSQPDSSPVATETVFDLELNDAETTPTTPVKLPQDAAEPSSDQQALTPQPSVIRADNCMVQYINKVSVPAKAEGTLMELKFEEGDTVNEDDVLAVIDDTAARLATELKKAEYKEAMINAANEVNLKDAKNSEKLATAEAEAYVELRKEGAIPFWEMEKKRLEAERARLRIEVAEMQKKIAEVQMIAKRSELEIADFELTRRQITAPSTGFVEARIAQLGEWVQPGSPLYTLIQMDRLRVEGDIDALRYPRAVRRGTPVEVTIYNEAEKDIKVNGKLGYVSMEIDLNNRYRVWVEIENEKDGDDWLLKPGMRAEIEIRPDAEVF